MEHQPCGCGYGEEEAGEEEDKQKEAAVPLAPGTSSSMENHHAPPLLYRLSPASQLLVRQLPTLGLSFQVWPAASALCWLLEKLFGHSGMSRPSLSLLLHRFEAPQATAPQMIQKLRLDPSWQGAATLFDGEETEDGQLMLERGIDSKGTSATAGEESEGTVEWKPRLDRCSEGRIILGKQDEGRVRLETQDGKQDEGRVRLETQDGKQDEARAMLENQGGLGVVMPPLLLSAIEEERHIRVLELGAGTGIVGILAAVLGAHVTITDLPHVIPNLRHNANLNESAVHASGRGGSISVEVLRWGEQSDIEALGHAFDLILASDVVYNDHLFEPLLQTLRWLCRGQANSQQSASLSCKPCVKESAQQQGKDSDSVSPAQPYVLLAHLRRWKKDAHFFRRAGKFFDVRVVHRHPHPASARTGVLVYCFKPKPDT